MIFGTTSRGQVVHLLTLDNGTLKIELLTLGVILRDVRLAGVDRNLTIAMQNVAEYEGPGQYFGSLVGPVANRISRSRTEIDGYDYLFSPNDRDHLLHSGTAGIHRKVWTVVAQTSVSTKFELTLGDGVDGFPGNRVLQAEYALENDSLQLTITAKSDAATLMNIAQHSYWNLDGTPNWEGHRLAVDSARFLPEDNGLPTGEIASVEDTEFDLRIGRNIRIGAPDLDTNFCIANQRREITNVATLTGTSGVEMAVSTTQAGLQVYDGRDSDAAGLPPYAALAIEAQGWPNSPNERRFPSIELAAKDTYRQVTRWTFSQT